MRFTLIQISGVEGSWAFDIGPLEPLVKYFYSIIKIEVPRADNVLLQYSSEMLLARRTSIFRVS